MKIGICGYFGGRENLLNGQTIKTKILTEELENIFGKSQIKIVDTYRWKKHPFKLLLNCIKLISCCENIIILPAHNGVKVFAPMFIVLNKLFKKRIHYVVIGGWLSGLLEENIKLIDYLSKLDGIYVETTYMKKELNGLGLKNVKTLKNFKRLNILDKQYLESVFEKPFRLCTFSRVMEEKGIEDAVKIISEINEIMGTTVYTLDIYGEIDIGYINRFEDLKKSFPDFIHYKGKVEFDKSVSILKEYFILLFPTKFKTEGIPGTIIDSYSAGLPVVASNWNSASEIINDSKTGFIYEFDNTNELMNILIEISKKPSLITEMKLNCLDEAEKYSPEKVMNVFINYLEEG